MSKQAQLIIDGEYTNLKDLMDQIVALNIPNINYIMKVTSHASSTHSTIEQDQNQNDENSAKCPASPPQKAHGRSFIPSRDSTIRNANKRYQGRSAQMNMRVNIQPNPWRNPIKTLDELKCLEQDVQNDVNLDTVYPITCALKLVFGKCWTDIGRKCVYPHVCIQLNNSILTRYHELFGVPKTSGEAKKRSNELVDKDKIYLVPVGYMAYKPKIDDSKIYFALNTRVRYGFSLRNDDENVGLVLNDTVYDVKSDQIISFDQFLLEIDPDNDIDVITPTKIKAIIKEFHNLSFSEYNARIPQKFICNNCL